MLSLLKKNVVLFFVISLNVFLLSSCATAPYTNRPQLMLIDLKEEARIGRDACQYIFKKNKLCTKADKVEMVRKVGKRNSTVIDTPSFNWEFWVIEDCTPNAFCLPGGKVFVNTGMFQFIIPENFLATVLAHEIAHTLARHGAERLSATKVLDIGESLVLKESGC